MKKLFSIFALLAMFAFAACEDNGADNIDPSDKEENIAPDNSENGNSTDEGDKKPDDARITISQNSIEFSPWGDWAEIWVYSNYAWEITSSCDWCTLSPMSGEGGDDGQVVHINVDASYDDREGTIEFSCGNAKTTLVVSQKFMTTIIADENNTFTIPAEGGLAVLAYQTTVACDIFIPEDAMDWISIAPATRGLVSESITICVAENTTGEARSAIIKVAASPNWDIAVEYIINQVSNDIVIAENNTFEINWCAQELSISYQTNAECEVVIPVEAQNWISVAPATRTLENKSAMLSIAENDTDEERTAVVKVVAVGNDRKYTEYTIKQNQKGVITYTSTDGNIVTPFRSDAFEAHILSNTYNDGIGVIVFDKAVRSIGTDAFYCCSTLESITIPGSVTSIGSWTFAYCSNLTSVTIPDSVTWIGNDAFAYCSSLTSITIPNSITSIQSGLFSYCSSLTSVTIPDSVTAIEASVFSYCSSLTSFTIPDSVTAIKASVFDGCSSLESVTIGNSVTEIGDYAFYKCSSLTSLIIPDSVTSIGDAAFAYCSSLESISIPNNVTSIGTEAFSNCTILSSATIGNGITSIPYRAFYYCVSLADVNIPNSVKSIEEGAFMACSMTNITIPNSVTSIEQGAFYLCDDLTSITIPDSITAIEASVFNGCSSLASISIPNSVTSIGESAFYACLNLDSVELPDNVTSIGASAFSWCVKFTSITIPHKVTSIGNLAFNNCSNLTAVYCKPTTPPRGGYSMFNYNASECKIYVPAASIEAYKNAPDWGNYVVEGYDFSE